MKREVGEKGQIVIPKDIREQLGMKPGSTVIIEVNGDEMIVKRQKDAEEFLKDFLNVPKLKRPLTIKEIKKTLEEEYELR